MASKIQDPESYNRVFILGAKTLSEELLRETFDKFGCVKDVYFIKDRHTNERKDVAYITFSKASEAALAIEEMNGKTLGDNPRPLKVLLANSRNEGSVRDPNEESKMLRLFIMVPKSYTEKDVKDDFLKYGEIDYIRFVKDRQTGESRGLAYVKYFRSYHAALALEGCDAHYKPVFASAPKPNNNDERSRPRRNSIGGGGGGGDVYPSSERWSRYDKYYDQPEPPQRDPRDLLPEPVRNYPNNGEMTVEAILPTVVSYEQANRLFDLMPCMEFCNFDQASGLALAKYSSPQAAAYAKDKLDGFEYPPGYRLIVRTYRAPGLSARYDSYGGQDLINNSIQSIKQSMMSTVDSHSSPGNVKTLVDAIQKAMNVLKQTGQADVVSSVGFSPMAGPSTSSSAYGDRYAAKYCSVPLPDRQPMAPSDSEVAERLFIVSTPDAFPASFLEDCFCRFGNLIGAFFMPGKKYGYVKYATSESAQHAVDVLHGQTVCGNRMKVMIAEPPQQAQQHQGDGKRKRDDFDDFPSSRNRRTS